MSDFPMNIISYRMSYQVIISTDIKQTLEEEVCSDDVVLLDANVAELHKEKLDDLLGRCVYRLITPNENEKTYERIGVTIDWLLGMGFSKNQKLIAIGGGVTQDICSFISSILFRGISWKFVPTNMLSQTDSCIGSKTSVNFGKYKNQLGGFYPPEKVILDHRFLDTLGDKEIRSGLGEALHFFMIDGDRSVGIFNAEMSKGLPGKAGLMRIIKESLLIKKRMIEIDEFDKGPRNIFNYGHSFGHALESYTNFAVPHGIAVSFGMDIANSLSVALGMMDPAVALEMRSTLQKVWWPCAFPSVNVKEYMALLQKDKKNIGSTLRVVLSEGPGRMTIHSVEDTDLLASVLKNNFDYYHKEAKKYENR